MEESQATRLRRATGVLKLLQGKWTLVILDTMRSRPVRLSDLRRAIPSASKKALTSSLRSLETAKVIVRKDLSTTLLHVEYSLSKDMESSIIALLDHIITWGATYERHLRVLLATSSISDDREDDLR